MRALCDACGAALAVNGVRRVFLGRYRIRRYVERPLRALLAVVVVPDSDVFEYLDGVARDVWRMDKDITGRLGRCEILVVR